MSPYVGLSFILKEGLFRENKKKKRGGYAPIHILNVCLYSQMKKRF